MLHETMLLNNVMNFSKSIWDILLHLITIARIIFARYWEKDLLPSVLE